MDIFLTIGRGILGLVFLLFICYLFSANRKNIDWKLVGTGVLIQILFGLAILRLPFVTNIFQFFSDAFVKLINLSHEGTAFIFGRLADPSGSWAYVFAVQVLPNIIFFAALSSVLYYLGILQKIVYVLAWVLNKLKITGPESLSTAANIFLGQTEAPLMIKAYLEKMNKSEMLLVMIGGMATVAGAVMAAYISFLGGDDPLLRLEFAKHLLAASVMAAPGAIVISKILYPQTEPINTDVNVSYENIGTNVLDAIANGTTEGLKLAANVAAMLLVFIAFIAMINYGLGKIGEYTYLNNVISDNTMYEKLSIETILGMIFSPIMWLIGVASDDIMTMGQLLGIKLASSEFVAYAQLAELKNPANAVHLVHQKSVIMATYMLCGFANFASIGIQIGGIGSLAPGQRQTLSEFGMKALLGGTIASLFSATIIGALM